MNRTKGKKVIIIGVGNSGTKLLGELVWSLLKADGYCNYYYEPLYWSGVTGEAGILLDEKAIAEHRSFPLLPGSGQETWPWMDSFIAHFDGLAKFIRAGSRARTFIDRKDVKYIWITRELYSYLGSMQQNFPRCLPDAGWHHRPGKYDDAERLKNIYPDFALRESEEHRIELEAAWWHLHNREMFKLLDRANLVHIRYEELCESPETIVESLANYLGVENTLRGVSETVKAPVNRNVSLSSTNIRIIEALAGTLNRSIYGNVPR